MSYKYKNQPGPNLYLDKLGNNYINSIIVQKFREKFIVNLRTCYHTNIRPEIEQVRNKGSSSLANVGVYFKSNLLAVNAANGLVHFYYYFWRGINVSSMQNILVDRITRPHFSFVTRNIVIMNYFLTMTTNMHIFAMANERKFDIMGTGNFIPPHKKSYLHCVVTAMDV